MTNSRQVHIFAFLIMLLATFAQPAHSQVFSNYDPDAEFFQYQVKVIDEFIERFNDDKNSYLRKTYAETKKPYNVSRMQLLVSLFNMGNTSFTDKDTVLRGFFRQVLDKQHPVYLSFNDSDWYANAKGIFLQNGKLVEIPLVLRIESHGDEWAKWMIAGIGNKSPCNDPAPSISVDNRNAKAASYISTSAYATNFVELHYIFSAGMKEGYYFDPKCLDSKSGKQFISQVKNGTLKFQYVKDIAFHFYHVKGWIFTVEQFNRKTFNNGWLINSLKQVSGEEKRMELNKLLNR